MNNRWLLLALMAITLLLGTGSPQAGAGALTPPPAFKAGVAWVYRHTSTEDGQTKTGTSTMVYKGLATYRGASYHLVEFTLTLAPGSVERQFLVWDRGYFRQAAVVLTDGSEVVEIVFDRPVALGGVQETRNGGAEIYQNGALQGTAPWSSAVLNKGTARITVPAGSFSATRWEGTYTLGQIRQTFTVYMVGAQEVRADIEVFVGGTLSEKERFELLRGPVEVR